MRKSDVLFLIVGTNPMPNVISILNRVKENGKVFLIHSNEKGVVFSTESIANSLINIFKEKSEAIVLEPIAVNMMSESNMVQEVKHRMNSLNNSCIELNYTGGTKLMSSTIYGYFKEEMRKGERDIILSYLDCEKELFIYEKCRANTIISIEEKIEDININNRFNLKDIIKSHGLNCDNSRKKTNFETISYEFFSNIENMSYDEKESWLEEFNEIFKKAMKKKNKEILIDFIKKYSNNILVDEIEELSFDDVKDYVLGDNLEEFIFRILTELKDKSEIDDFIWSYEQMPTDEMASTEIDFVIIKGMKNYLLSVTLCEEEYVCKPKLYEAKMRGEQLAGDETRVGFICLYKSHEELEELIGANGKYSKDLIIAIDNFNNIKDKLIEWFRR